MQYVIIEAVLLIGLTINMILLYNVDSIVRKISKGESLMKLPDSWYNVLKYICQIGLPALGTFYFTIAQICGLPYAEQVVGVIAAVTTLLGTLLGISTYQYKKGISNADD